MKMREIGAGILAIGATILVQSTQVWAQDRVAKLLEEDWTTQTWVLPSDTKFSEWDTQRVLEILENFKGAVWLEDREKFFSYLEKVAWELEEIQASLQTIDIKKLRIKNDGERKIFPTMIRVLISDIDFFSDALKKGSTVESVLIQLEIIFSKSGNQWVIQTITSTYPDFFKKPILSQTFKSIYRWKYQRYAIQENKNIRMLQAHQKVTPRNQTESLPWQATIEVPQAIRKQKSFFEQLFWL